MVQGRGGAREEVHAAAGRAQAARPRAGLHVAPPHVRAVQPGRQKRLQGNKQPKRFTII